MVNQAKYQDAKKLEVSSVTDTIYGSRHFGTKTSFCPFNLSKEMQLVDNTKNNLISVYEQKTPQIDFLFRPSTHSLINAESQVVLE